MEFERGQALCLRLERAVATFCLRRYSASVTERNERHACHPGKRLTEEGRAFTLLLLPQGLFKGRALYFLASHKWPEYVLVPRQNGRRIGDLTDQVHVLLRITRSPFH